MFREFFRFVSSAYGALSLTSASSTIAIVPIVLSVRHATVWLPATFLVVALQKAAIIDPREPAGLPLEKVSNSVHLRRRYPNADIVASNPSIGGFTAKWLKGSMWADAYPANADLICFHDYSDLPADLEEIFADPRRLSTDWRERRNKKGTV